MNFLVLKIMASIHRMILLFLFINIFAPDMLALQCYFCADTGRDNRCGDPNTYIEAFEEDKSPILRNCTEGSDRICYIEIYKSVLGVINSEIRDCNDGSLFSFSSSNDSRKYAPLENLGENNETRCVYDGQNQVCLSKCTTDFCNGPQVTNAASHFRTVLPLMAIFLSIISW